MFVYELLNNEDMNLIFVEFGNQTVAHKNDPKVRQDACHDCVNNRATCVPLSNLCYVHSTGTAEFLQTDLNLRRGERTGFPHQQHHERKKNQQAGKTDDRDSQR